MATSQRQPLPPCCHAVHPGAKDTTKARFKTELSAVAAAGRQDAFARLAAALTDTRSALQLDRSGFGGGAKGERVSRFSAVDDIQSYMAEVAAYLSLVKGFYSSPAASANPPAVSYASVDASTPASTLRQPLIGDHSPLGGVLLEDSDGGSGAAPTASYSAHLKFCVWKDVLTNTQLHALNARHEYAQALLASGIFMVNEAREKVDALLGGRLSELDETQLKLAYQLFLSAAGVFDACLEALDVTPRAVGAAHTDLSVVPEPEPAAAVNGDSRDIPDDDMMEKWRAEQLNADAASRTEPGATTTAAGGSSAAVSRSDGDLAQIHRVPDLAHGRYPQLLAWLALAEAQELVILRGMSREFVDFSLMAKLSMDIATRYRESNALATQTLPCATSPQADKVRLYATFKAHYYVAISVYFQGAACMEREDAASCAQAIANFKKAKLLMQQVAPRKQRYEEKARQQKEDRERLDTFKAIYVRSEQIVDRDLDIMTHRNDSVYYERIPEAEAAVEPLSLVRATAFPAVDVHALWRDADVATCLKPIAAPVPAGAAATRSTPATGTSAGIGTTSSVNGSPAPPRQSCCESCVIS
ncbi:hypothetical protein PybrP1_007779 [[Pythium] brassicae (nom. inval.)]|nr:hypothetical protein PybrP1_007779 [[Pythium] brassicae (nom. inval.)]